MIMLNKKNSLLFMLLYGLMLSYVTLYVVFIYILLYYYILFTNYITIGLVIKDIHVYMCSILRKGSTCRKNKNLRFLLILKSLRSVQISILEPKNYPRSLFFFVKKIWACWSPNRFSV